jgi:maltose alpha-D-glucosyltransferase/alpha-amylase
LSATRVSTKRLPRTAGPALAADPLWYKDAIFYQLHVRSFNDSDGDGMGDFRGLTQRLDYLRDLGVTALWLLPFYPSPWKDDGYDISDYFDVHPAYGTLRDFQVLLREAHRRGLRVITELVVNHTSDQHAWFQRARRARPGSRERNYYVWSDTPDRYLDARIIFKDFEPSNWAWDPLAHAYYWHRFYAHQPDLNFDSPAVRRALLQVADFWLEMGVDGLRLDAVPYLFEREGTDCENLPETHEFLQQLRTHVDDRFRNRMLLAEANQWPEDAAHYFGDGSECHMAFHFPVMPRLFMAIHMEDRFPIVDILAQTPAIPDTCQWAIFLRNHDELTLEMVTDEERDYMYRAYASDVQARINLGIRRRLAPLLANNRRRIELMNSLLLSLPGSPIIYYGDELGMGDNIYLGDRNGVRTPMQWSADRNAGFSHANPQQLFLPVITDPEYHYEALNVEAQQANPASLLWWTKRLIALRKRFAAFGRGSIEFLSPANRKVLVFLRHYGEEHILVVTNLSRFAQYAELDLSAHSGRVPVELFGSVRFRQISKEPYILTLGPHSFFWFELQPGEPETPSAAHDLGRMGSPVSVEQDWRELLEPSRALTLQRALATYLQRCRWFGGKSRVVRALEILEQLRITLPDDEARWLLLRVSYTEGEPEVYSLAIACAHGPRADELCECAAPAVMAPARTRHPEADCLLYDAIQHPDFPKALLDLIARRRTLRGQKGKLFGLPLRPLRAVLDEAGPLTPRVLGAEQSNSSILYRDEAGAGQLLLKLVRRIEPGPNPDVEIGRYLNVPGRFQHTPPVAGSLEFRRPKADKAVLGVLQEFVPNQGDAWAVTLDLLNLYLERAASHTRDIENAPPAPRLLEATAEQEIPPAVTELIGAYLDMARLLGTRTAELHLALAQATGTPELAPEPFNNFYRHSLYQSIRGQIDYALRLLPLQIPRLEPNVRTTANFLVEHEPALHALLAPLNKQRISAKRTRIHGDYHLGQVLYTGKDFVIIDFEGPPARSLAERRRKRSPLLDVAGMLRSFDYAAQTALRSESPGSQVREEDRPILHRAAELWRGWTSAAFVSAYRAVAAAGNFLPAATEELQILLNALLLEKMAYELKYELNNRPHWAGIPLAALAKMIAETHESAPAGG